MYILKPLLIILATATAVALILTVSAVVRLNREIREEEKAIERHNKKIKEGRNEKR